MVGMNIKTDASLYLSGVLEESVPGLAEGIAIAKRVLRASDFLHMSANASARRVVTITPRRMAEG